MLRHAVRSGRLKHFFKQKNNDKQQKQLYYSVV